MPKDQPRSQSAPERAGAGQLPLALGWPAPVRVQLPLPFGSAAPDVSREALFVSPANREAVGLIDAWPRWPHPVMVLVGPRGAGKTHLARTWQVRAGAASIEPAALEADGAPPGGAGLIEWARSDRPLTEAAERGLFHRINAALAGRGDLLLTADRAPGLWPIRLADLRSRLEAAGLAVLGPPDDDLLGAVLLKLFIERQLKIGPQIVPFLVTRMERSLAAAARLVAAVDRRALERQTAISDALIREILAEEAGTEEE